MNKTKLRVNNVKTDKFSHIKRKFEEIGAKAVIVEEVINDHSRFTADVPESKDGQYFKFVIEEGSELQILDQNKDDSHLLLFVRQPDKKGNLKILCGYDEREWFTSQVTTNARNILDAKEKLQPDSVVDSLSKNRVKPKDRITRNNKGFKRQGEWFFIPVDIEVQSELILTDEPLFITGVRAGTKPHIARNAYRIGGETVYVPNISGGVLRKFDSSWRELLRIGLTEDEKKEFLNSFPDTAKWSWRMFKRNPDLYVTGTIRHPDHKTLKLQGWHRVIVNGEIRGKGVVFLD